MNPSFDNTEMPQDMRLLSLQTLQICDNELGTKKVYVRGFYMVFCRFYTDFHRFMCMLGEFYTDCNPILPALSNQPFNLQPLF